MNNIKNDLSLVCFMVILIIILWIQCVYGTEDNNNNLINNEINTEHQGVLIDGIYVDNYSENFDYMQEIIACVEEGTQYSLKMGKIYELKRNLKIDTEGLAIEKSDIFNSSDLNVIQENLNEFLGIYPDPVFTYNAFEKSNLREEHYNNILAGTPLSGMGYIYVELEETYGVNGLFAVSVAMFESGWAKHTANSYNYYGFRGSNGWMGFSSAYEGIMYFGKLMNKSLYYGKSIDQIGLIYCEGNTWASNVKTMMQTCWNKI